ncbi:MAG: hypothetical protein IJ480_07690 [Clostridia bacterium]|nr:hypothetical protein [Clostridia bacterium]
MKPTLHFHPDGTFRVLMVSDIHGGVGYNREQTVAALQALVDASRPDLVFSAAIPQDPVRSTSKTPISSVLC